jgi:hypothetical protein
VATKIYIFGEASLWSSRMPPRRTKDLERDLNHLLQDAGEVTWDGDEDSGTCWNVDLLLYNDTEVETWIRRVVTFLREWGVPDRTLSLTIIWEGGAESRWEHRRIEIAPE